MKTACSCAELAQPGLPRCCGQVDDSQGAFGDLALNLLKGESQEPVGEYFGLSWDEIDSALERVIKASSIVVKPLRLRPPAPLVTAASVPARVSFKTVAQAWFGGIITSGSAP